MIRSLPQAYEFIKEMDLSVEWEADYRRAARNAVAETLEGRMKDWIGRYLEEAALMLTIGENRSDGCYDPWTTVGAHHHDTLRVQPLRTN